MLLHALRCPFSGPEKMRRRPRFGPDGAVTQTLTVAGTTMAELRDSDGSALVIHAQPDDNKTDPSGNSGDRIACAVIAPAG